MPSSLVFAPAWLAVAVHMLTIRHPRRYGGVMVLSGGLIASNIIWNFVGTGSAVSTSGGGGGVTCVTSCGNIQGTILAVQRDISIAPGAVFGAIISGGTVHLSSGSAIACPNSCASSPPPAGSGLNLLDSQDEIGAGADVGASAGTSVVVIATVIGAVIAVVIVAGIVSAVVLVRRRKAIKTAVVSSQDSTDMPQVGADAI